MIDAVITWVDGDDPAHAARRQRHAGPAVHAGSQAATRFASRGEIGYAVASILSFCPFVDRVLIVTDAQRPGPVQALFDRRPDWRDRVRIVDHHEMFGVDADLLPVFSSRSIETMLFRIPGLSERFLYFNDDIFVGRPLTEDLFFRDGLPVLRGDWQRFPHPALTRLKTWLRPAAGQRASFRRAQQQAARMVGFSRRYFLAGHRPHPMRRSTLARFFESRPDLLRQQAGHRFRSAGQFSPIGLAYHLEIGQGADTRPPGSSGYLKPSTRRDRREAMLAALARHELDTFCVQSLDAMPPADQSAVLAALDRWRDAAMTA